MRGITFRDQTSHGTLSVLLMCRTAEVYVVMLASVAM